MNPVLKQFYETEAMRETVKAFLITQLEDLAIQRVFDKQTVAGIYEARKVIDSSFSKLEELFDKPKSNVAKNSR